MKTRRPDRQCGFSLVEQMLSLCIVSLSLGAAVPGLKSLIDRRGLEGAAAQLESEIGFARGLAVARNQAVRVSFESSGQGMCYVIHTGGSKDCSCANLAAPVCSAGAEVIRFVTHEADRRITIKSNSASFAFDPTMGTVTPTATLELKNQQGEALRLIVNIMGRVRSCSPTPFHPSQPRC